MSTKVAMVYCFNARKLWSDNGCVRQGEKYPCNIYWYFSSMWKFLHDILNNSLTMTYKLCRQVLLKYMWTWKNMLFQPTISHCSGRRTEEAANELSRFHWEEWMVPNYPYFNPLDYHVYDVTGLAWYLLWRLPPVDTFVVFVLMWYAAVCRDAHPGLLWCLGRVSLLIY